VGRTDGVRLILIMILPQTFYRQDTISVAKKLLGCYLVHLEGEETTLGRIVETEAYLVHDPAAHSFTGKTKRNAVLFGPVGYAYVYFIYGLHYCFNVVTGEEGMGEAVLIRALEPLQGIPVMRKRRRTEKLTLLCNGPARLAEALAITLSYNGMSLFDGPLQMWSSDSLSSSAPIDDADIVQTTRIGIAKARESSLRFYLKGNGYISRK
jgi:DNA-3-methyladenine glycosylase